MPIPTLWELVDHFRAWRRGERRIAPYGTYGRVYERINEPEKTGEHAATARAKAKLEMKIVRADGTVETRRVKARITEQ